LKTKTASAKKDWYAYIIRCSDNTLYCGIAKDVEARFCSHAAGKGAKYTRGRAPLRLAWVLPKGVEHGEALRLERQIKKMPRQKKLELIANKAEEK
jgi:putative endonuclease